jgi:hypothetical protein
MLARDNPEMAFTSLNHYIDYEWVKYAYDCTRKDGAVGVDGQTGEDYAANLEQNLLGLIDRLKSGRYQAQPVRRHFIEKADGGRRGLGIPSFEEKVAQRAIVMLLEPIYEQDFLGNRELAITEKVSLVNRIQHFDHRALDDLVFQRGNPQRTLFAVRLWYVLPPNGQCPIRSALYLRMQTLEVFFQSCLVVPPRQAVHSGRRIAFERKERLPKPIDRDVVQKRGEPFLLPLPCSLPYTFQPLWHACPVLRPARVWLIRVPLGPRPWLHPLRSRFPDAVRRLRRYYGGV